MKQSKILQPTDPEADIVTYLREHSDFFVRHREVLPLLSIPHASGTATSLVERQLAMLREKNLELEARLQELMSVAGENDRLSQQIENFAIALIETPTLTTALARIKDALRENFDAKESVLKLGIKPATDSAGKLIDGPELVGPDDPGLHLFHDLFKFGRPKCGRVQASQGRYLFGDRNDSIASVALIPLEGDGWQGLLAVGDTQPDRFVPGMGTLFLQRIGALVAAAVEVHRGKRQESEAS